MPVKLSELCLPLGWTLYTSAVGIIMIMIFFLASPCGLRDLSSLTRD